MSRDKANDRINNRATSTAEQTRSHTGVIVVIAVLIVCILVGVILYLLFGRETESNTRNTVVTPDNIEEIMNQLADKDYTAPGSYEVTMNTDWTFANGKAASADAYVENCVRNTNTVYFTITLANDDSREIYHSPYLELGSHIENITLDEDLDAGVYDAVLTYHLVDDDMKDLSEVSVSITITVQN